MKKIELVFRTVGERTSYIALDFALQNIKPDKFHIIKNVKPFSRAMDEILKINYDLDTDIVVFMDADCLIFEDLRPFLNENNLPYVDCFVLDQFRGFVHMGVHITRIDVVRAMQQVYAYEEDLKEDVKYVLRPESRIREIALQMLNEKKTYKRFKILHDYCQYYEHIYVKYAIRELRSRNEHYKNKLNVCMEDWIYDNPDFIVARKAIVHVRNDIPVDISPEEMTKFIEKLPKLAKKEIQKLRLKEKKPLRLQEVLDLKAAINVTGQFGTKKNKVFCIGLSRTSTKSITLALHILGINVIHYPVDETTFNELTTGKFDLSILKDYDGISDITVSPYYAQLDKMYPNSKFILTVRDKKSWLASLKRHWSTRDPFDDPNENATHLKIRRFLRASVYGIYTFDEERLSYVYDLHLKNVLDYFKDRPDSLLVIDICAGDSWDKLCPFLKKPLLKEPFPNVKWEQELYELL